MKKHILISLFFITSCSTSRPVLMGSGSFTGRQISSCVSYLLTFNLGQRHHLRLDFLMNKFKLKQDDIYSVEFTEQNVLGLLYQEKCLVISLNKKAINREIPTDSVPF